MMFNLHLLQSDLTVREFRQIEEHQWSRHRVRYLSRLPAYVIANCPICLQANIERLNTYTVNGYDLATGMCVFHPDAVVHHCSHFTYTCAFYNFHNLEPADAEGFFAPEVPFVIGLLLSRRVSVAVMHALPVCQIESDRFVPRFTMFLITYFSERTQGAYREILALGSSKWSREHMTTNAFALPPVGSEDWWDLKQWVNAGLLYWLDASAPDVLLRTADTASFPYMNITGRQSTRQFPRRVGLNGRKLGSGALSLMLARLLRKYKK